jgi:hypothetical protein
MPLGQLTYLMLKGKGDNSMSVKRRTEQDVYAVVPQDPCAMVKAGLPEPQFPVMQRPIRRYHV